MSSNVRIALCLLLIALVIPALPGQDMTRGSIGGIVRESSGAVVPEATLRLESPYGTHTAASDANGFYLFPGLIAGSGYGLTVQKPGFRTARIPDLEVRADRRTTVDVILATEATAQRPSEAARSAAAIDAATAAIGHTVTDILHKSVPVERNVTAVAAMIPGVSEGPAVHGAPGPENRYFVNGAPAADPAFGSFGIRTRAYGELGPGVSFDFADEVQVKSGAFETQYGQAAGGIFNVVTRSGSNAWHGSIYSYFQPHRFEAERPDANRLTTSQRTRIEGYGRYDFGGSLGGYLWRDRLFFYGGFNPTFTRSYRSAPASFANRSLGTVPVKDRTLSYLGKLTWNASPNHQFEGSVFGDPAFAPMGFNRFWSLAADDDRGQSELNYGSRTWTARYQGQFPRHLTLAANYSHYWSEFREKPKFDGYQIFDRTAMASGGGERIYGGLGLLESNESSLHQLGVSGSWRWTGWGGHLFQYGYQFENVSFDAATRYTGAPFTLPNLAAFGPLAGQTVYGAAILRRHLIPADPSSPVVLELLRGNTTAPMIATESRYHAAFLEDSWSIHPRVTIRPGVRYEYQWIGGNRSGYVFAPNWAPRIGVIVDPEGNRRSKALFNYGRFFERIPMDLVARAVSFGSTALGGLYRDQPGGIDLSPANYLDGTFSGQPLRLASWSRLVAAPGTRVPYQDEWVAGYERELRTFTVSSRFLYRRLGRVLEDVSGISLTQAEAGVPQQFILANPSAKLDIFGLNGALGRDGSPDGFADPKRIYKAAEFAVHKRFAAGWQLFANYRLASLSGNYDGWFRNETYLAEPISGAAFDFVNTDLRLNDLYRQGPLALDRRHTLKLFGNYQFSQGWLKNLDLGMGWNIQSGAPLSQWLPNPVYNSPGLIPAGGRGALGRTDWTFPFDLHAGYTVRVAEGKSVKLVADLFNLFNQKRLIHVDQSFLLDRAAMNPDFRKPDTLHFAYPYQVPFHARLGVRFEF